MNRTEFATPQGSISICHWNQDAALTPDGKKPILHWAHANGFNAQTYDKLLAPLAEQLDIYAWDARGHGLTELPANPDEMKSWLIYAEDLERVIERLHAKSGQKIWLAGHSMGGCASVLLAAKRPDMVAGLVLVDPVIVPRLSLWGRVMMWISASKGSDLHERAKKRRRDWPDMETVEKAYTGRGAFASWQDGFLQDYLQGGLLPITDAREDDMQNRFRLACDPLWEAANFKGPQLDASAHIKKLRVPLTLLMAESGSTTYLVRPFKRLKGATKIDIVAGTTHFVPMERPDLVRDEIIARIGASACEYGPRPANTG